MVLTVLHFDYGVKASCLWRNGVAITAQWQCDCGAMVKRLRF